MPNLTAEQIAQMESDIAAQRAADAEAARVAENERRAGVLEAIEPLRVAVQNTTFRNKIEAIREALPGLWSTDQDLANLTRNALTCVDAVADRLQRRIDDHQPSSAPPPPPPPAS